MNTGSTILTPNQNDSMEWHHAASPMKKKARTIPSRGKIMGTDFPGC
jgi:hypothetical protein